MSTPVLGLGVEATGVDAAVADLGRVESAASQIATSQTRRFSKTIEEIEEEIEYRNLRAQALDREKSREAAAAAQSATVARSHAEGLRASQAAQADAAATAIQFTTRLQGAASAVTALAGALGTQNAATGLVANIAGTAAQFAQMGNMLGPQGAVVGGILGAAIPAITALGGWIDRTRTETLRLRDANQLVVESYDTLLARARQARESAAQTQRIAGGFGTIEEQTAARDARLSEASAIEDRIRRLREIVGGDGTMDEQMGASNAIPILERELARSHRQYRELAHALEAAQGDAAGDEAELMGSLRLSAKDDGIAAREAEIVTIAPERGSGGRSGPRESAASIDAARNALRAPFSGPVGGIENDAGAMLASGGDGGEGLFSSLAAGFNEESSAIRERNELLDEARVRTMELAEASKEAQATFGHGWTTSLADVAQAFNEANRVMRASGQASISTGRLMERSLVAVGNNIAETIGGTMKGAFEDALGAWMDGSKSFVQAAEDMVKGVVKALVIESIVQAVTEFARGVASLASQDYVAAPQHFAAAAAWAAVGVVAGGVGAGIGAFGGGGGGEKKGDAGGGADSRSMGRDSVREAAMAAPVTINVFPGGLVTRAEVASGVMDAIEYAARDGRRLPSGSMRGGGS